MADEQTRLVPHTNNRERCRERCKGFTSLGCIYLLAVCHRSVDYNIVLALSTKLPLIHGTTNASVPALVFDGTANFFGIFGGVLADAALGSHGTALLGAIISFVGGNIVSASETFSMANETDTDLRAASVVGLSVVAVGSAILRVCLAVMCGEQTTRYFGTKYLLRSYACHFAFDNLGCFTRYSFPTWRRVGCFVCSTMAAATLLLLAGLAVFKRQASTTTHSPVLPVLKEILRRAFPCVRLVAPIQELHLMLPSRQTETGAIKRSAKQVVKLVTIFTTLIIFYGLYSLAHKFAGILFVNQTPNCWEKLGVAVTMLLMFFGLFPLISRCVVLSPLKMMGAGLPIVSLCVLRLEFPDEYILTGIVAPLLATLAQFIMVIPGLEFSYTQAPLGLVATVMGLFMCSEGIGVFVGILMNYTGASSSIATFIAFVCVAIASYVVFIFTSMNYEYTLREEQSQGEGHQSAT